MEKEQKEMENFKGRCGEYLAKQSVYDLRAYGRHLNLSRPTDLRKKELIEEIVCVLCEEKKPIRTKRGAPIKSKDFSKAILDTIDEIRKACFGEENGGIKKKEIDIEETGVSLQISVDLEKLNNTQKRLLKDFLNSL